MCRFQDSASALFTDCGALALHRLVTGVQVDLGLRLQKLGKVLLGLFRFLVVLQG